MALPRPAPTVRLRLTALYGVTFLVTGALLLTIGYLLVRHNLSTRPNFRGEMQRLGLPLSPGPPRVCCSGSAPGQLERGSRRRSASSCAPMRCIGCSPNTGWRWWR